MNKKLGFSLVLIAYLALLVLFAVLPSVPSTPSGFDKIFHFGEFFMLTIILFVTASAYVDNAYNKNKLFIIVPLIALLVAVLSEVVQLSIPTRSFDWLDLLADAIGIFVALVITWIFYKR